MKQILRIIAVLVIGALLAWVFARPINKAMFEYKNSDRRHLTELFENSTTYDVLFLGSSRTHRSIYPGVIDSICGVSSYNAGIESGTIADFELTLKGYLFHHPSPRLLVLTLDLPSLSKPCLIHYYPQYYPYLDNIPVDQTLRKYGYHTEIIKYFPFVMITDFDDYSKENAIRNIIKKDTSDIPDGDFDYKGFISNTDKHITKEELEEVIKPMSIGDESIASLNEILDICRQHHIQVLFTYAPEYNFNLQKRRSNVALVFNYITQTANKNNILFLRHDSLSICKDPMLFANNGHLNKKGAIVYSSILASSIDSILRKAK